MDQPIDDREYGVADNSDEWETPGDAYWFNQRYEDAKYMEDIRETFVPCKCSGCLIAASIIRETFVACKCSGCLIAASELRTAQPETD